MIVPSVVNAIRLNKVFDELGYIDSVELSRSTLGKPILKVLSGSNLYFYVLDKEPLRVMSLDASTSTLRLNDVIVKRENSELILSAGGRVFRGKGFIKVSGTQVYFTIYRKTKCLAGLFDIVDGMIRLYEADSVRLDPADSRSLSVSPGFGGFSVSNKSLTLLVSVKGVEIVPGFFKFIASCPTGDYIVDREGFLVRVRKGVLDVLGRVSEVASAACLSDGVAIADKDGLKIVRYGAYTTVLKEAVREMTSFGDVISLINRNGLIKILNNKNSFTLDSPLLKSCVSAASGVVCLTEDLAIFLDPAVPIEVEVKIRGENSGRGPVELVVKPWFEGCRFSITPKFIALWEQKIDSSTLYAKMYSKIIGWEGYVRIAVECPTYCRSIEEYVKFSKLELEEIVEKSLTIAKSGRLLGSADHNCVGRITLRVTNYLPLPVPIEVRVPGVSGANVALSNNTINPGFNEISARFSGRCSEKEGVLFELTINPEFFEPREITTIYIDPREYRDIEWNRGGVEVFEAESKSVIKAPGCFLRLYCSNGSIFEGRDHLLIENCEEPAILDLTKVVDTGDGLFELKSSRLFRDSIRKCLSGVCRGKAVSGGFYAECEKYEASLDEKLYAKIEYEDGYKLAVYLGSNKVFEQKLEPTYLLTGLSVGLGSSKIGIDWRDLVWLVLKTALSVSRHVEGVLHGSRNL